MKYPIPLALLTLALGSATAPCALAQAPAATRSSGGTVSGRVQNVVTGNYLAKARVAVKGTDLVTYTDDFGNYRLVGVPAGPVTLEVFYTDLDAQEVVVSLTSGGSVAQDVGLTSKARYGATDVVKLDAFTVAQNRETDAAAIAVNEQRFAPNIKNVMATDELGDVLGSNVGEFLKFMPGMTAEYSEVEIVGINLRGIGGGMTSFTSDGAQMVTANASPQRNFNMNSLALNNISRIEVAKVPTPSTPADSLAGSVNFITKSAFERSKAQLNYGVTLIANHENLTFSKTPHTNGDHGTRKILPSYEFDYTLPLTKDFGIVLTGMRSDKYNEQHLATTLFNTNAAGTGASVSRPYLQQFSLQDGPRSQSRTNLGFKADWRIAQNSVLSLNLQRNDYKTYIGTQTWAINAGTVAAPTVVGGTSLSYGENYTIGATGRGAITLSGGSQTFEGGTDQITLNHRFDDGRWRVESGVNMSISDRERTNPGHFGGISAGLRMPVRISLLDTVIDKPRTIQVFDQANNPVDIYDINNYQLNTGTEQPYRTESNLRSAQVTVRRRFDFLPFPTALQAGVFGSELKVDSRVTSAITWTYNGPDGLAATPDSAAPYQMQSYRNQDSHYGFRNVPWISVDRAYKALNLFSITPANQVAAEANRITGSEYLKETVSAGYVQAEAKLFKNRLTVLTGVRFEKTEDFGQGPRVDPSAVFVRTASGAFARDGFNQRIRKPEAGAPGSMQELLFTRTERGYEVERSYDGYYPSLHFTFDATENFLVRAAYAKTYGRPNLVDIIPNATFSENDLSESDLTNPAVVRGTIAVRNTALLPWTADNFDLSFEYYTDGGGIISAGVFRKDIKNFFGTDVRLADAAVLNELGLDPRYIGWNVSTKFNSGDARITGGEFNVRQSLRRLGRWGQHFTVFANATKLDLDGNRQADFTSFIPKTGNWGFSFNWQRVSFVARWNYRGFDKRTGQPAFGTNGYDYFKARTTLDLNGSYRFTKRLSVVASAINVLNEPQTILRYGDETPHYAIQNRSSEFGIALALGIKGSF